MKILIAIPCMDKVDARFAQSLATLKGKADCQITFHIGSLIYESRNNIALEAYRLGVDAIMWFDSDMIFEPDTLERMVKHLEEGKDIVSGLYFRRCTPYTPVLFKDFDVEKRFFTNYNDYPEGTFEVGGIGFGCCITTMKSILDVILNYQGQVFTPLEGFGEDLSFCWRARQLGYKVYCDSTIKCGHSGSIIITEDSYKATLKNKDQIPKG